MKLIEAVRYAIVYRGFNWWLTVDNKTIAKCGSYEEAALKVALFGWPLTAPECHMHSGHTFCVPDDFEPGRIELESCHYAVGALSSLAWVVLEDGQRCTAVYGLRDLYEFFDVFGLKPVSQDFKLPKTGIMTELKKNNF